MLEDPMSTGAPEFEARDKRTCSMRAFLSTSVSQSYNPVHFYCQIVKKRWTHEAETPDFLGLLCPFWASILIKMSRSRLGMELGGEVVTRSEWNTGLKPQEHTWLGGETGRKSEDILTFITDWGSLDYMRLTQDTQKWISKNHMADVFLKFTITKKMSTSSI